MAKDSDICQRFSERYRVAPSEVTKAIELAVIGGDWGANGYTTRREADWLAESLRLGPGTRMLDLGAGRGWPGLYLAATSGCEVVLLDPPFEGLQLAMRRARQEGLVGRAGGTRGRADLPPIAVSSFDAVVHTDVVCCLRRKAAALRASWSALKPGGRTAFSVITVSPNLTSSERRRASRDGPVCVASPRPYAAMLRSAGFVDVDEVDCTDQFQTVASAWLRERERYKVELIALLGEDGYTERQTYGAELLVAIQEGRLRRSLFTAVRPERPRPTRRGPAS